jgi:serine O-acetyltransferase
MARKLGFDAYGATADAPDPVAHAINCMLDHLHVVDTRLERMCEYLQTLDYQPDAEQLPDLVSCEIVSTAEELNRIQQEMAAGEGVPPGEKPDAQNS